MEHIFQLIGDTIITGLVLETARRIYQFTVTQPYQFDKDITKRVDSFLWASWGLALMLMSGMCTLAYFVNHIEKPELLLIPLTSFILAVICTKRANTIFNTNNRKHVEENCC